MSNTNLTNKGQEDERLLKLSLELNQKIKDFEKEHGVNIWVGNVGYRQYPERFPNQEKLQLFDVIAQYPTDLLSKPHVQQSHSI
jgi:hypothetical protein